MNHNVNITKLSILMSKVDVMSPSNFHKVLKSSVHVYDSFRNKFSSKVMHIGQTGDRVESDMVKKWLKVCVVEDKTVVVVVALYCSVSRNSIRFKALSCSDCSERTLDQLNFGR